MTKRKTGIDILDITPAYKGTIVEVTDRRTGEVIARHEVISWAEVNYWYEFSDEPSRKRMACVMIDGEVKPFDHPIGTTQAWIAPLEQYQHLLEEKKHH